MAQRKRICMILEGCYPYVRGGVSTWMHNYIQGMPQYDFVLWVIAAEQKQAGNFKYELPANVIEVRELFLDAAMALPNIKRDIVKFTEEELAEHKKLLTSRSAETDPDFKLLFDIYNGGDGRQGINVHSLLMSYEFLNFVTDVCRKEYPYVPYTDFFHTLRSMLLPLFYLFNQEIPKADVYHSTSTGYAGVLGTMATLMTGAPYVLTEHGIYTREREEEIIRADWLPTVFKPLWNNMFKLLSRAAYKYSAEITCLFERAKNIQTQLGANPEKVRVIPNGIDVKRFNSIAPKADNGLIDIAAVARFHPIKDIKTLIQAFVELKYKYTDARLHILGDIDDRQYYGECKDLAEAFGFRLRTMDDAEGDKPFDICFTGNVDSVKYLEGIDFTILTSISEGQPLAVLESLAAGRPCVATNVGCCREILLDEDGGGESPCGVICPPMDIHSITSAMLSLCESRALRERLGKAGRKKITGSYIHETMLQNYISLYGEVRADWQE